MSNYNFKLGVIFLTILLAFSLSGCSRDSNNESFIEDRVNSFNVGERYSYEISHVKKIRVRSGNHAGAVYTTTDITEIEEISRRLSKVECTLAENQEDAAGWSYYIDFYESEDSDGWFRFTFGASPIDYFHKDIEESKNDQRNYDISFDSDIISYLQSLFK